MYYVLFVFGIISTGVNTGNERIIHSKPNIAMPNDIRITLPKGWVTLLEEHFESGIPGTWTVNDGNGDGYTWGTGITGDLAYPPPNYGSAYAYYSDDDAGSSAPPSLPGEDLITPPIYAALYSRIWIIYGYGNGFNWDPDDTFGVWIRTKSGGIWSSWVPQVYYPNSSSGWDTLEVINAKATFDSIQVMFRYLDHGAWEFAVGIDNVYILGEEILSHDVGVYSFSSPPQFYGYGSYDIISTYKNFGQNPENFNIYVAIKDENLATLYDAIGACYRDPGDTLRVNWGSLNTTGHRKLLKKAWTTLSGDMNPSNDTLEQWIYADIDGRSFYNPSDPHPPIYAKKDVLYTVWTEFANVGSVGDTFDITIEIRNNGNLIFTNSINDAYIGGVTGYNWFWGQVQFPEYGTYELKQIISSLYDIRNANDTLIVNGYVSDWKFITNMPQPLMDHCVVIAGSKLYVFGGYNGTSISNLYIYDFNSKVWTTGASMPIDLCMGDACVLGDTIYFPGGFSYSSYQIIDNLYKYSISGNNWTVSAGTGEPAWFYTCKPANGKVYKIGGYNYNLGVLYASTWEYNPSTGLWTKKSDMPFACQLMLADVLNDTIYLVGGYDGANIRNETRFYDAINNNWTMNNSIFAYYPIQILGGGAAFFRDTFYCISGMNASGFLTDSVFRYDKGTNTWVLSSPVLRKVYRTDAVGIDFGKGEDGVYLFGGSVGGFNPIDSVFGLIQGATGAPEEPKEISVDFISRIGSEIRFTINGIGTHKVSIFDITGRKIKTLNAIGGKPVRITTREFGKGVYFVNISGIEKTYKVILIK